MQHLKQGQPFDDQLLRVKHNAIVLAIMYVLALPGAYYLAEMNDAPGIIVLSGIILGITVAVVATSNVLRTIVRSSS